MNTQLFSNLKRMATRMSAFLLALALLLPACTRQLWVTGIETLSKNGKVSWQIRVSDPDLAEAQLVPLALAGGGVTVCEFGRKAKNLEEVFMNIVEENNHDHL